MKSQKRTLSLSPHAADILAEQGNASAYVSELLECIERDWRQAWHALRGERREPEPVLRDAVRAMRGALAARTLSREEALAIVAREYWAGNGLVVALVDECGQDMPRRIVGSRAELDRIASELIGEESTEAVARELAELMCERADKLGIRYGEDWSRVTDVPEPAWLEMLDIAAERASE